MVTNPDAGSESRFCEQCGQPLAPGAKFCARCGTRTTSVPPMERRAVASAPPPSRPSTTLYRAPSPTSAEPTATSDFFTFRRMVTPIIIQVIFWVGAAICVLAALAAVLGRGLIYGPLLVIPAAAAALLILRIYCELLILFFRMNETLTDICTTLRRQAPVPAPSTRTDGSAAGGWQTWAGPAANASRATVAGEGQGGSYR